MFRSDCKFAAFLLAIVICSAGSLSRTFAAEPAEGLTAALLSQLSPEHLKSFAQMLEQDWKDRPEWGDMALAIMKGEPMRPGGGWWRASGKRYDWEWLRAKCDANGDGDVAREELPGEPALASSPRKTFCAAWTNPTTTVLALAPPRRKRC